MVRVWNCTIRGLNHHRQVLSNHAATANNCFPHKGTPLLPITYNYTIVRSVRLELPTFLFLCTFNRLPRGSKLAVAVVYTYTRVAYSRSRGNKMGDRTEISTLVSWLTATVSNPALNRNEEANFLRPTVKAKFITCATARVSVTVNLQVYDTFVLDYVGG